MAYPAPAGLSETQLRENIILLDQALYALWHLPQKLIIEHADPSALALSLLYLFLFGLLLGWIMRKSGNILAPTLYHAIHNWVLVL